MEYKKKFKKAYASRNFDSKLRWGVKSALSSK